MSNVDLFSPVNLTTLIRVPLIHFFSQGRHPDYIYDPDPIKTKIIIDNFNDYNQETAQKKPRILVRRGDYQITHVGLTDNLVSGKPLDQTFGLQDNNNGVFIRGQAGIVIEAREQGVCEVLTDMVTHFLTWTSPMLCSTYGFKQFALPLSVSEASPGKEDTEIFSVSIGIPWLKEEMWNVKTDALMLNVLKVTLAQSLA